MGKTKTLLKTLILGLFSTVLIFTSCEIGLGAAVDTMVPTISIDSPAADSTIRDSFAFRGTWSDDGAIMGLTVTLKTIEGDTVGQPALTKSGIVNYAQVIGQSNTWECTIEPGAEELKDGKYEATITITDMAGHATSVNRQITVDNTAPVVVLQRPGTDLEAAAGEMDSYGQTLSLEGQAADDSSISHIDVKVYADSKLTQLLDTVTLSNVPPTISLDVAKFGEIDYTKIYGSSEKQGTKYFWCEIEAYDSAERYPADGSEQSEEDKNGNCEKTYYLYEEIATSVLSQYKITELYKIKSGTWKDSAERSAEGISAILSEKVKRGGSFSLNPDNSPTFRVISGGLEGLRGGEENFSNGKNSITNGGELAIEVNPGLDNIPLAAGMKVYAVECDGNGNALEGAVKLYPAGADSATKSGTKYTINPVFNQSTASDGTGGFVFNHTYLLGVEGADESGNAIVAKEGAYGFIFTSSGARPAVTVVTPDENEHFIAKDGTQTVSGSVTVEEGVAALEIKVYRAGDEANAVTVSDSAESASHALYQSVNENGTNSFNYAINCGAAPFSQTESGNYVIKVRASQGAKETVVTRSISYDVKGPEVKRISCEPVIKASDNSDTGKKNGTISVTGEFSDDKSGFENGSWKVWKAAETGAVNASTAGSFTWQEVSGLGGSLGTEEFNFNVDTRAVESSDSVMRGMKLEFTATDAAGNTKRTEYYYTVDQSTDIPSASGNAKLDLTLAYNGSSGIDGLRQEVEKDADVRKNVFTTGGQLVMSVKDDDGIANVVVQTVKNATEGSDTYTASTAAADIKTDTYTYNGETSTSVTHDLPQVSGSYRVTMTITDTAGVIATGHKEYTFYVQVTGPAPDATVSGSPEWITTNAASGLDSDSVRGLPKTKFNVTVNVTDGSERVDGGPKFLVKRSGAAGDTWTESGSVQLETDTSDSSGKTYKEGDSGYVPAENTSKILYRVYDLFNNYKDIAFNYKIDNTAPGVEITSAVPTTSDTENASFTFRGEASDTAGSGVSKVEISFDEGASWEAVSGTTSWNYNAVFADKYTSEGQKSIKVRSVDEVGNITAAADQRSQSFMYDKAKPVLGSIEYQRSGDSSWSAAGSSFSTGSEFSVKGSATDTNGVAKVEISEWKDGELKHTYTLTPSTASTSYDWQQTGLPYTRGSGNALVTGSYTYKVKVYDVSDATNPKTEEKTFTLNIDLDAPEVSAVNGLSAGTNLSILDAATYAFSGKVKDLPAADAEGNTPATGVESMEYAITGFYGSDGTTEITTVPGGTTWTNIDKSTNGASEEDWNTAPWTLNTGNSSTAAANSLNEGKYKIWIRAKDKAGNAGSAVSRAFYVDKAAPVLSFATNATDAVNGYLNKSSFTGTSGSLNLNGQAVETNGFEYLRYKKNNETPVDLTTDEDGNWTLGFTYGSGSGSSYLADGTYTFTVEARDKAGRDGNTLTGSWTIDTKDPDVSAATSGLESDGVTKKEITDGRWFKSRTVSIEVPAADNAAAGGQASGISLVEWSVDGTNWNAITKDANADIYKGPVEFTGTGAQTLYIRATDKAGNVTFWPSSSGISVNIDETAPLLEKTKYQVAGNAVSEEDSVYINGTKSLTVYGTYSDTESGVKALSVKKSDGASTFTALDCTVTYTTAATPSETSSYAAYDTISNKKTITGWKCEITAAALDEAFPAAVNGNRASIKLRFDGENMADATTTLVAYSLIWDETPPTIPENAIILKQKKATETSYTDDVYKKDGVYYLNPTGKTLYVSGSASDKSGLASVTAAMGGVTDNLTQATGFSNEAWAFTDFNGFAAADADNTEKTITITAVDKAGNSNTATLTIKSDITGPAGIHLIDDSGKDIFFRVGNYNADTNEGISSDTAISTASDEWTDGAKYDEAKDADVGGKYSGGTFGNATTVTVRGRYEDVVSGTEEPLASTAVKGSGLKMIYYKVYSSQPTLTGTALIEDVVKAGKISPKEDTKRVFYKDSSSTAAGNEFTGYNTYVEGTAAGTSGSSSVSEVGAQVSVTSEGYIGKVGGKNRDRNWTTVKTSFCETLSGFEEGVNYFVLVAEDNAGNRSVDTVRNVATTTTTAGVTTTTYNTYPNYMLNVDTQVPDITPESNATVYTNLAGALSVSGTAGDTGKAEGCEPAGIKSIELEVNGHKITEDGTTYGSVTVTAAADTTVGGKARKNNSWSASINANAFSGLSGNITVYAEVKDASGSGNSQRVSVATVNVDEGAPVPSIEEPADADDETAGTQVNRIISLGGSVRDDESSVERILGLCYTASTTSHAKPAMAKHSLTDTYSDADSTDSWYSAGGTKTWVPSGWTKISCSKSGSTSSRLSFTGINTEHLDGSTATSGTVWISAAVQDKAGNVGYSEPVEVIINQDSDRPKVTLNSLEDISTMADDEAHRVWLKYSNKLNGKIEDDDGIAVDTADGKKKFWYSTNGGTGWTAVEVGNGGSWSIELTDGSYSIMFKVKDGAGKTFITNESESLDKPKLRDQDGHTKEIALNLGVDKTSPVYTDLKYSYFDSTADSGNGAYTAWEGTAPLAGGNRTKYAIQLKAGDENKIKSVKLQIGEETPVAGTATTAELTTPGENDGGKYYRIWEIKDIDVSAAARGAVDEVLDAKLLIEDKAGLVKEDTVRIHVDNKAPVIGFTEPKDTKTSCGDIPVQGTVSGSPVKMQYAVSADGTHSPDQIASVTSWSGEDSSGAAITDHPLLNTTDNAQTDYGTERVGDTPGSHEILGYGTGWQLTFDGQASTSLSTHGKKLNEILTDFGITTATALGATTGAFEDIVYLYVWIKSEDEVGNISRASHKIKLDPQGDRPVVDFSYPLSDDVKMGGKVKIYGTATDPAGTNLGVDSVWIQIKEGAESFSAMTKDNLDFMAANGYNVYNIRTYDTAPGAVNKKWGTDITDKEDGYEYSDYAALTSSSGASWNIEINRNLNTTTNKRELDPPAGTSTKTSTLRVIARDGDGKLSVGADRKVIFDADKPVFSGLRVVQKNAGGTVTSARQYAQDMYVKGEWYLDGKVTDKDNIGNLTITINGTEHKLIEDGTITAGNSSYATRTAGTSTTDGEATFTYPLESGSGVGKLTIKVEAEDAVIEGTKNKQEENLVIFYDNQSPDVAQALTSGIAAGASTITVKQSDGWYSFGSMASEPAVNSVNQSGYAYTAFYFKRSYTINGTTTTKLYDVLKGRDDAVTDISSGLPAGLTAPATGGDGLYWYSKTATRDADNLNVLTISGASASIRKNSLVKIGGALYLVTDVSGNSVTINGYPDATFTDVKVALAAIVDHTVTEAAPTGTDVEVEEDGYYAAPQFDDGDRMIESVNKNGSDWRWNASICSKNIPDGPVELVYTVFDNAGNYTVKTVSGTVDNNHPRIAGVTIKTDYNGDNQFDGDGEVIDTWAAASYADDFYTGTKTVEGVTKRIYDPDKNSVKKYTKKDLLDLGTFSQGDATHPKAVLKGRTQIIPEVVGGNGAIHYSYDIGGSMSGVNTTTPLIATGSIDYTAKSGTIDIQVGDLLAAGDTADENTARQFSFVLYDSTDGSYWNTATNTYTNAKTAAINLWFAVRAADDSDPEVTINPFYWKGLNDNSIYLSAGLENTENPESSIPAAESYEDLLGHIELPSELTFTGSTFSSSSTGIMDLDPKVSGKIVLEGSVHDAKRLFDIQANIFGTEATLASIPDGSTTGLLESQTGTSFGTAGYYFEIKTQTLGEAGHDISWKLYVDTEVVGISGADKSITITAQNFGVPSPAAGTTYTSINGTTTYGELSYPNKNSHAPSYQMDIVPYVTEVLTSLSEFDEDTPSIYSRTALGHYPVYMTFEGGTSAAATATSYGNRSRETVTVKGFNLKNGTSFGTVEFENGDTTDGKTVGLTQGANQNEYSFMLPKGARSGKVTITVGSGASAASTLNNLNNNDGRGIDAADATAGFHYTGTIPLQGDEGKYKNFYNRIPNGTNNNTLTDDLYFDVWEFNEKAAAGYGGGKLDNAIMKINPKSGMIGFAFSNGSERFSMGGADVNSASSEEYSYLSWSRSFDYMGYTAFEYDSTGHSYGAAAGGDINTSLDWDYFTFMTDRWSQPILGSGTYGNPSVNKESRANKRLEGIGQYGDADSPEDTTSKKNVKKERIQNACYGTYRITGATCIYIAYYDLLNNEVRFKAGALTDSTGTENLNTNHGDFGTFKNAGNSTTTGRYADNSARCQIVASNADAGNALALGVTSNNIVTLVWFDETAKKLKFMYNDSFSAITTADTFNSTVLENGSNNKPNRLGVSKAGWTGSAAGTAANLISGSFEYCQMAVDGNDCIHIVAYDSNNANLKYIYIPKGSDGKPDAANYKACTVDSYLDTGSHLSLDVAKDGDYYIPQIGYWTAYPEKPHYAYLAKPETFFAASDPVTNGAVSADKYTGVWECSAVPCVSSAKEGKISVGVWKKTVGTAKGVMANSNDSTFTANASTLKDSFINEFSNTYGPRGYGKCYGNGTKNAVMAYVVTPSDSSYNIETAQKR